MAVMLLAEDGKLGLDDPVSRYVPALATYPGVTIRHLLTHTGGLPEYYDVIDTTHGWPSNPTEPAPTAAMQAGRGRGQDGAVVSRLRRAMT